MSEVKEYDFSTMLCPKPLIQTKALIKESDGTTIKVIVPVDSALRFKEMVKKEDWHVVEQRREGFRFFFTIEPMNLPEKATEKEAVVATE